MGNCPGWVTLKCCAATGRCGGGNAVSAVWSPLAHPASPAAAKATAARVRLVPAPIIFVLEPRSEPEAPPGVRVRLPDRGRHAVAELLVELAQLVEGLAPLLAVDVQGPVQRAGSQREPRVVEAPLCVHVADRRLRRLAAAAD